MKRIAQMQVDGTQALGRGTPAAKTGRFEAFEKVPEHDGWDIAPDPQVVRTEVRMEPAKSILTQNTSPDIPFDRSINPYRGCEHGCVYCYARPSHAFLNLSPGLDFETKLLARPNAAELLEKALKKPKYKPKVIAIGTNTDPYQPIEKKYEIMRGCLQVLQKFNHPVAIVTKGTLIERDIDILSDMAQKKLASVGITITTLDADLSRKLEPRAAAPKRMLQTIKRLSDAGVPVRVMVSPIIPGMTDHELDMVLQSAAQAGARYASWIMLRLPREVEGLFTDWIKTHYPNKADKVLKRLNEVHGGQVYDPKWGRRMRGQGIYAQLIAKRFAMACTRLGLNEVRAPLRTDLFAVPAQKGDQLGLF